MFILLVECGLMHRDDCINCETCYFCFDPAFVWPSLAAGVHVFIRGEPVSSYFSMACCSVVSY